MDDGAAELIGRPIEFPRSASPTRGGAGGLEGGLVGGEGEEVQVAVLLLLGSDPGVEAGGDQAAAVELLSGGLGGEVVGVLVLRVAGVPLHPLPLHAVPAR